MPETFLNIGLTVFFSIIAIGLIVFIHELGHFIAAKKAGVIVLQFAFGFGPKIWSKKWHGTEYRINIIPVGGYIMMLGDLDSSSLTKMREELLTKDENELVDRIFAKAKIDSNDKSYEKIDTFYKAQKDILTENEYETLTKYIQKYYIPRHPGNFENIPGPKKFAVIIAGVIMNLVLGIGLFYLYFALNGGYTDLRKIGTPVFVGAEVNTPPIIWFDYSTDNIGETLIIKVNSQIVRNGAELKVATESYYDKPVNLYVFNVKQNKYQSIDYILDGSGIRSNFDSDFTNRVLITAVTDNSAAAVGGIEPGDIILSVNNEIPASTDNFKSIINLNQGKSVELKVLDLAGAEKILQIVLPIVEADQPVLGVSLTSTDEYVYANSEQLMRVTYRENGYFSGVLHSINVIGYNFSALGELVKQAVAEKSIQPVSGSVNSILAVPDIFYSIVKGDGYLEIINIAALVSVSLGITNVLPIPLFDGGHLLFMLIEKVRGKKIPAKTEEKIGTIFFYLLIGLSIVIMLKDVLQFDWINRIINLVVGIFK